MGGFVVAMKPILAGARLFRGVRRAERPSDVRQISYPPAEVVTSMGRLNRVGSSMFYCSAGEPPVSYELKARVGDTIAVSEWEVLEPLWLHNLGFHEDALVKLGVPFVGSRPDLTNAIPDETTENERLRRKSLSRLQRTSRPETSTNINCLSPSMNCSSTKPAQSRSAKVVHVSMGRRGRCIRAFNLTLAQITWLFSLNLWTAVFKSGLLSTQL